MIKLRICNGTFSEGNRFWPLKTVMEYISNLGYQGMEIASFTFAPSAKEITYAKRREIRLLCKDYGLEIIGLHWFLASPKRTFYYFA